MDEQGLGVCFLGTAARLVQLLGRSMHRGGNILARYGRCHVVEHFVALTYR